MSNKLTIKQFIEKAEIVHANKYDYSLVEYKNIKSKVKIICPQHGIFEQTLGNHLQNHGCPKCSTTISVYQKELFSSLLKHYKNLSFEHPIKKNKTVYFADICMPDKKIIIEYYDDYWHCNPKIYDFSYFHKHKKMYAHEIWGYDNNRINMLKSLNYKIIIVWESNFKKNKKETIDKCLNLIQDNITY